MIAHVGGVPVEEILPALATAGTGLMGARAWLALRLRRRRQRTSKASRTGSIPGADNPYS